MNFVREFGSGNTGDTGGAGFLRQDGRRLRLPPRGPLALRGRPDGPMPAAAAGPVLRPLMRAGNCRLRQLPPAGCRAARLGLVRSRSPVGSQESMPELVERPPGMHCVVDSIPIGGSLRPFPASGALRCQCGVDLCHQKIKKVVELSGFPVHIGRLCSLEFSIYG